jgi:hypothetical protein
LAYNVIIHPVEPTGKYAILKDIPLLDVNKFGCCTGFERKLVPQTVFRIRMFSGLLDPHPDPYFFTDLDPSINQQKTKKKNLIYGTVL